jgi:uncharacterized membrane protein (DUF441 family)
LVDQSVAMLLLLLGLGLLGRNNLVVVAALIVLALRLTAQGWALGWLSRSGIDTGLTFMTLAVLAPLAAGQIEVGGLRENVLSPVALLSVLGGVLAAWVCARGLDLLRVDPRVIVGLVVGSILGATFANGVPVGPLFAAGLTAIFLSILRLLGL